MEALFEENIALIEGVQRKAMKLVHHLKDFQYEDRLRALHLTMLDTRWLRGDLTEAFKIFEGLDKLQSERFFTVNNNGTRSHELKLFKPRCRLNYAFSHRIVDIWSELPFDILACNSVNNFKHGLRKFLEGYSSFVCNLTYFFIIILVTS